jgi:hypothetical protein
MTTETKPKIELIGPPSRDPMAILLLNRVCGECTPEEALTWIQTNHPAGTRNNWQLSTEEHRKPVPCVDNPKRTHYMFEC